MRTSFAHTVLSAAAAAAAAVPPAGFDFPAFVILAANASSGSNGENPPTDDSYNLNTKFNPSMAIIVVVLLTAFFFMAFFSIYVRKCGEESDLGRGIGAIGAGGVGERRENVAQGLDRSVIESFPVFTYELVKGLKTQYQYKEIQECAVCLNDFEDNESLRLLPKCGHAFHPECIDMWLCSHITCPVCRTNLVPDDIANPTGTAYGVVEPRPEPVPNADVTVIPRVSGSLHGSSRSRSTRRMEQSGSLHLPIPSPTLTPTPTPMPPPQVEEPVPAAPKPPRPVPSPVTVPERLSVKFDLESIKPDSDADADGANLIRSHSTGHSLVRMRKETGATEWFISTPKGLAPAVHLTCTFVKVPLHSRSQGPSARFSKLPFSLSVGRSSAFNASGGDGNGNGSVSGSLRRWYDRRIRSPLSGGGVADYGNFPRSRSEHRPAPPCVFNPENTNLGPEQQAAASTVPDARDAAKIYLRSLRRTIKRLTGRENGTGAGDNVVSDPSSQRGSSRGHDSGSVGSAYPPTHATV